MEKTFAHKKIIRYVIPIVILILFIILANAQTKTIEIKSLHYIPNELTIKQGMTVIWVNKDTTKTHQVFETFNKFRSKVLFPGESFNFTFNELGTYVYRDAAKPNAMQGMIIVVREEDYKEVAKIEIVTNETLNQTNITNQTQINATVPSLNLTTNITQNQSVITRVNETTTNISKIISKTDQNKTIEKEVNKSKSIILKITSESKSWLKIILIISGIIFGFLILSRFFEIKPIEIKEEIKKSKKEQILPSKPAREEKELKGKITLIDGNTIGIKCPKCGYVSKTIISDATVVNIICGNCNSSIYAKIKKIEQ